MKWKLFVSALVPAKRTEWKKTVLSALLVSTMGVSSVSAWIPPVTNPSFEISFVQDIDGVTGTMIGTAPYDPAEADSTTMLPSYINDGTVVMGGSMTNYTEVGQYNASYDGGFSIDLAATLMSSGGQVDADSVSGPMVGFRDLSTYDTFYQDAELSQGDAVTSTVFFACATLHSLGITETNAVQFTFSNDLGIVEFTFSATNTVPPVINPSFEISFVQDTDGVTGTLVGTVPYFGVDGSATHNLSQVDEGMMMFGPATESPGFVFSGEFSVTLDTFVNGVEEGTSGSGPLMGIYNPYSGFFYQDENVNPGDVVTSTVFFADETLLSLKIAETNNAQFTFTPSDTVLSSIAFTFSATNLVPVDNNSYVYVVHGAGTTGVNGVYTESGTFGGVPAYTMGVYSMGFWADMGAWVLIEGDLNDLNGENYGDLILYYAGADTTPPEYWDAFLGTSPAPVVTPVAQGSTVTYYVADSGTTAANGHYTDTGTTLNGYPVYAMGGYVMGADGYSHWVILEGDSGDIGGEPLYFVGMSGDTPPESGWNAAGGSSPAPTVYEIPALPSSYVYVVHGAGTAAANGVYTESGTFGGVPAYTMGDYSVGFWTQVPAWIIINGDLSDFTMDDILYYNEDGSSTIPPESNWNSYMGSDPAPTVNQTVASDDPVPDPSDCYLVYGAGTEAVNGVYTNSGIIYNDHVVYIKGEYCMGFRSGSWDEFWVIVDGGDYTLLEAEQGYCPLYGTWGTAGDTPPQSAWYANSWGGGVDPAPTVIPAAPTVAYSGSTFTESTVDDGSVSDTLTITYWLPAGDSFSGSNGPFDVNKYSTANVPDGLTVAITRNSDTELSVALTGSATAHYSANSISDMQIVLLDAAFTGADSSGVNGVTNSAISVNFHSRDEFCVSTDNSYSKLHPSTDELAGGGFVVVWSSWGQDGSSDGIYGQRFAADGSAAGSEFQINTYTDNAQSNPSVAALADGGFVVVWDSWGQDGYDSGIYGQRFAADGSTVGDEFLVTTYVFYAQIYPDVAALSDGGFIVSWTSDRQDGNNWGVYGQRFAADGSATNSEFLVNASYTNGAQLCSSVAAFTNGGFLVVWSSDGQDGSSYGVYGRRYSADGSVAGDEFQVNTYTNSTQEEPSVAVLMDGGFVVTWDSDGQDGSGNGVYGQRYNSDGLPAGDEFRVAETSIGDQYGSEVSALCDGGFIVAWQSSGSGGISMRKFAADGTPASSEIALSAAGSYSWNPSPLGLSSGSFIVTWHIGSTIQIYMDMPVFACGDSSELEVDAGSSPVSIDTLLGAYNKSGADLTWSIVSGPSHGSISGLPDAQNGGAGMLTPSGATYQSDVGYAGPDSFVIEVSNGGVTTRMTVTVSVDGGEVPMLSGHSSNGKFNISWPAFYGNSFNVMTNSDLMNGSWGVCNMDMTVSNDYYVSTNGVGEVKKLFFKLIEK